MSCLPVGKKEQNFVVTWSKASILTSEQKNIYCRAQISLLEVSQILVLSESYLNLVGGYDQENRRITHTGAWSIVFSLFYRNPHKVQKASTQRYGKPALKEI